MAAAGAKPIVDGQIYGKIAGRVLLDSGCLVGNIVDRSWLLDKAFAHNRKNDVENPHIRPFLGSPLRAYNGEPGGGVDGVVELTLTLTYHEYSLTFTADFLVTKSHFPLIVGYPTIIGPVHRFNIGVLERIAEGYSEASAVDLCADVANHTDVRPLYQAYREGHVGALNAALCDWLPFGGCYTNTTAPGLGSHSHSPDTQGHQDLPGDFSTRFSTGCFTQLPPLLRATPRWADL